MSRKPLTANTGITNRPNSSLFSRNTVSAVKGKPANPPGRLTVSHAQSTKPAPAPQNENVDARSEVSAVQSKAELGQSAPREQAPDALGQSRQLGDLLRSTNNSLAQLKVELGKMSEPESKKPELGLGLGLGLGETLRSGLEHGGESVNHGLLQYHKDLISELREENHKLLIADLRLKNGQEQMKQTQALLSTESSALRDRLATEKLKNEMRDQELASLSRANAELSAKLVALERESATRTAADYNSLLELKRKDEMLRAVTEQLNGEAEARRRHNAELELERMRNAKLQLENERLKVDGRHLLEAVETLKGEIATLKRSNQNVLELLRY